MQPLRFFNRATLVLTTALVLSAASLTRAAPAGPSLATADARELWRKGSDQVLAGDFVTAISTLKQVQRIEPGHSEVSDALDWMRSAEDLNKSRAQFRRQMYDYWVKKALDSLEKARNEPVADKKMVAVGDEATASGKDDEDGGEDDADDDDEETGHRWKALVYAQNALANTPDEDAFRAEPWLPDIVEMARAEIDRHEADGEWRDALTLYDVLRRIHPKNEVYKKGFDFSRTRAHLEFAYGKKTTWRTDLSDVTPDAIREIVDKIADEPGYVEKPDFRRQCRDGLERLVILAEFEALSQTFPQLSENDLVARFVNRINGLIKRRIDSDRSFKARSVRSVFKSVLTINRETLRMPEEVVVDEFIAGMLDSLDDYTAVIWPAEVAEFNKQTRGEFVGVGIQITQQIGKPVRVESPLADSPAYRAGIKPGDFITKVEGKKTSEMTITGAVRAITGEPGSIVELTIKDSVTDEERIVRLKREHIKIRTVRGHLRDASKPTGWDFFVDADRKIGYVRVSGFMDETVSDLEDALDQLKDERCHGLILDLRFNPGGLLTSAVNMCDLFLDEDAPIVRTKGRSRDQNMTISTRMKRGNGDMPLIVMVNQYSASASEIVAGALGGLKEACVVGTRTFGKGSVQNLIPIINNRAYLKLTTAHYYVPDTDMPGNDQWFLLHRVPDSVSWGIEPHVKVDVIPQEMNKILRLRRERDVLRGRNQDDVPKNVLERLPDDDDPKDKMPEDQDPDVDPQLVVAVDLMRMKLLSKQPWALAPRIQKTMPMVEVPSEMRAQKSR